MFSGLRSQWIILSSGVERNSNAVHNCWANLRVRLSETPRKLVLRNKSYRLYDSSSNTKHRWLRHMKWRFNRTVKSKKKKKTIKLFSSVMHRWQLLRTSDRTARNARDRFNIGGQMAYRYNICFQRRPCSSSRATWLRFGPGWEKVFCFWWFWRPRGIALRGRRLWQLGRKSPCRWESQFRSDRESVRRVVQCSRDYHRRNHRCILCALSYCAAGQSLRQALVAALVFSSWHNIPVI